MRLLLQRVASSIRNAAIFKHRTFAAPGAAICSPTSDRGAMPTITRTTTVLAGFAGLYYVTLLLFVVPHADIENPASSALPERPTRPRGPSGRNAGPARRNLTVNRNAGPFRSFAAPDPEMLEAAARGRPFSDGRREVAIEEVNLSMRHSRTPHAARPSSPANALSLHLSGAAVSDIGSRGSPRHGSTRRAWTTGS